MIHLAAALFFTAALLGVLVAIHLTVNLYWSDILSALRGELGLRSSAPQVRAYAVARRNAAA